MEVNMLPLFKDSILKVHRLNGVASEVWEVKTEKMECIVRTSGVTDLTDAAFVKGCQRLFHLDLRRTFRMIAINETLAGITEFLIPQVLEHGISAGRELVAVEKFKGETLCFTGQDYKVLRKFGVSLGLIHQEEQIGFGNFQERDREPLACFYPRMAGEIRDLAQYYPQPEKVLEELETICEGLEKIAPPLSASYIMADMDPRQFMVSATGKIAMVDTEGYAVGPREWDLLALEMSLDEKSASAFREGYESVLPIPPLFEVRKAFRYLHYLMQLKGPVDFKEWMAHPAYLSYRGGAH
jgi:hypothetical protein